MVQNLNLRDPGSAGRSSPCPSGFIKEPKLHISPHAEWKTWRKEENTSTWASPLACFEAAASQRWLTVTWVCVLESFIDLWSSCWSLQLTVNYWKLIHEILIPKYLSFHFCHFLRKLITSFHSSNILKSVWTWTWVQACQPDWTKPIIGQNSERFFPRTRPSLWKVSVNVLWRVPAGRQPK